MKTQHEILMQDPEFRRLLAIETLVAEAGETIARLMNEQKLSKADLARRLNRSRAWVTQLLSGKANMTVRTLAEVVFVLGAEVKLITRPAVWQADGIPVGAGRPCVVYKLDDCLVNRDSAPVWRGNQRMLLSGEEIAPEGLDEDQSHSEYAA